jgi:hypothetical protein
MSDKLTLKSDKCIFVGYPRETKWYYFYNKLEGKVFIVRNGIEGPENATRGGEWEPIKIHQKNLAYILIKPDAPLF